MNSFAVFATVVAYLLLNQPQIPSAAERMMSLERRAVADTQRTLASDLDPELPKISFVSWFERVVGPETGIVWQLSECGVAVRNGTGDLPACVEATAILPDDRRVIVMVAVGTFKRGMAGAPTFRFAVVEQRGELFPIRRLRDLQKQLLSPRGLANRATVKLPELNMPEIRLAANDMYVVMAPWGGEEVGRPGKTEEPLPPPPPPRTEPASSSATPTEKGVSEFAGSTSPPTAAPSSGSVFWGDVIKKVQPRFPARAKRVNASGAVSVRITIAEDGHVIEAKATSGHPLLRDAAVTAARQWVFKPAILNGVPVKAETVLVFVFTVPK